MEVVAEAPAELASIVVTLINLSLCKNLPRKPGVQNCFAICRVADPLTSVQAKQNRNRNSPRGTKQLLLFTSPFSMDATEWEVWKALQNWYRLVTLSLHLQEVKSNSGYLIAM